MNIISTILKKSNIKTPYALGGKYNIIFSRAKLSVKLLINIITQDKMLVNRLPVFHAGQYNSVNNLVLQQKDTFNKLKII
jgi:hypothetical protein